MNIPLGLRLNLLSLLVNNAPPKETKPGPKEPQASLSVKGSRWQRNHNLAAARHLGLSQLTLQVFDGRYRGGISPV